MTRFSSGLLALLAIASVCGCSGRPACAIDTDCPLGQACTDQHCVPRGAVDSGGGGVDAGRDAGSVDASRDARASDTGAVDAFTPDAGGPVCMGGSGSYVLEAASVFCPTVIASMDVAPGVSSCEVDITSREKGTFGGTVVSTGGSTFTGDLTIGDVPFAGCTVTFLPLRMEISCRDGCMLAGNQI